MAGGRPKKYTDKWLREEAKNLDQWCEEKKDELVLWVKSFAIERGYNASRLTEFAKDSEEFSLALKRAKDMQEAKLVNGGLSSKNNPGMSIFLLKSVHGHKDKVELSGDKENPIQTITRTIVDPKGE